MTLKARFLLIAIGLIIFVVLSPILILFARGYKIDFAEWEIVKTGSLVIKTEPPSAEIFLDDQLLEDDTPATLRFLVPKDYNLTLSKEGYQPWTKRLSIQSELVTWANFNREYVTLFLREPAEESSRDVSLTVNEPGQNRLMFVDNDQVSFIDSRNADVQTISNNANWLTAKDSVTLVAPENLYYFLAVGRNLNLSQAQALAIKKIQGNQDFTVQTNAQELIVFNNQSVQTLSVPNVIDFNLEGADLWLIESTNIRRVDLNSGRADLVRGELPLTADSRIIRGDGRIFLIINGSLYVISEKLEKIADRVSQAYWDQKSRQLVYSNDNEIFIFEPASFKSELVLRSSSRVEHPILNSETGYMFFSNEDKIKAIEIDGRDHRNIYTITDAGQNFLVSESGQLLYIQKNGKLVTYKIR
jgi:hypothetical protein